MYQALFPELTGKWCEINLNEHAKHTALPLEDPHVCARWINHLHSLLGVDYSYGGYLEDRSVLWKNHYMNEYIHLGVDFNVPAKTPVHSPVTGVVREVWFDPDMHGGWGGRVIIERNNILYIFAHLDLQSVWVGDIIAQGDIISVVGTPETNGGWFPHLHVQCTPASVAVTHDGYATSGLGTLNPLTL